MATPASKYPTRAGSRKRAARKPSTSAKPKAAAMVWISVTLCGMGKCSRGQAKRGDDPVITASPSRQQNRPGGSARSTGQGGYD